MDEQTELDLEAPVEAPAPEEASDLDDVHKYLIGQINELKTANTSLENKLLDSHREKRILRYQLGEAQKDLAAIKLIDTKKK